VLYCTLRTLLLEKVNVSPEHESKRSTPWLFFGSAFELLTEFEIFGIEDKRYLRLLDDCASVAAYHSDAVRTHFCLEFAARYWKIIRPGHLGRPHQWMWSPEQHPQWGHTEKGLSHLEDVQLFLDRTEEPPKRVLMIGYDGDPQKRTYDRILPKEEAFAER
jgi:hypothetical protein